MPRLRDHYPECPEAFVVGLARTGDRDAFEELVRRYQSSIRNLMRRCSGDPALADDLAQQSLLQAWLKLRTLKQVGAFGGWLRRLSISMWLQHVRKQERFDDASRADEPSTADSPALGLDLDDALGTLSPAVRLCIVLSYHEGMSHPEVAEVTGIPLGTVKSHITRGSTRLRQALVDYRQSPGSTRT